MKKPLIAAICGVSNSGKTTLIKDLIAEFGRRGMRVAVIKHDGHDFECDIPGTDSYAFTEAGVYGAAVFSRNRIFVHKTGTGETEADLIGMFPEADILLIEGLKDSSYPKVELVRAGISERPVSEPEGRFLLVTDLPAGSFDEPCLRFEETEKIASAILERCAKG